MEKMIYAIIYSLKYDGQDIPIIISRDDYADERAKEKWAKNRQSFIRRCSPSKYRSLQREISGKEYSRKIQEKYKVGPDWEKNRWFVEQVRPTLYT